MPDNLAKWRDVLLSTLQEADAVNYSGYSKFDGLASPLTETLSFGWWPLRLVWTQIVMRSPFNIRPILGIKKGINPEAAALFAHANLDCASLEIPGSFRGRARKCLDWLLEHDSSAQGNYHGRCWGYHHPWQSPGFYQPPGYPNCYITSIVTGALVRGYQVLGEKIYLDAARSACDFILSDLPILYEDEGHKCIAYVPSMRIRMQVININALSGAVLAQVGSLTDDQKLLREATKLLGFVTSQQTNYGAWFYTTDSQQSLIAHDNYHTGMILDALLSYEQATGDLRFHRNWLEGLCFYRDQLFLSNGAPKWCHTKALPHDVHGSAQGILTFSLAGDLEQACKIADWGLANFYKQDGNFSYQRHA
ncbi:MAG TPA: hypothetical protein VK206_15060, partial [Anaerolineales bacterium]|nr:hypothetical protein [Anaerolineales bacterium]